MSRQTRRLVRFTLTALEDRNALSFTLSATPTSLTFTGAANAANTLTVRTQTGQILWATDGRPLAAVGGVSAGALRSVVVTGGNLADRIDLSGFRAAVGARVSLGAGDDYVTSSPQADTIDGGPGRDSAKFDSLDPRPASVEVWNPMTVTADNQPIKVKVLVLDYDPRIPQRGNARMNAAFGLKDPHEFAAAHAEAIERTSGGAVDFEIVGHRTIDAFPPLEGGGRYTPGLYTAVREARAKPLTAMMDYPRLLKENGVPALVDAGKVDEVWLFAGPDVNNWEWAMAGKGAFYINGGVYGYDRVPSERPFAVGGFNTLMFGGVLLHGNGHRVEATMTRAYGGWNLANPRTNWDLFGANVAQSPGLAGRAGVGSVHWPANAAADYDYYDARVVPSYADEFLDYPDPIDLRNTRPVNNQTWRRYDVTPLHPIQDDQNGYMEWWYSRIPRAAGTNADGKPNNWWKLVYAFNQYTATGQPRPLSAQMLVGGNGPTFSIAYQGAVPVNTSAIDAGDLRAIGPDGLSYGVQFLGVSDPTSGNYRVGTYRVVGGPRGAYRVETVANQVRNLTGQFLPGGQVLRYARVVQ